MGLISLMCNLSQLLGISSLMLTLLDRLLIATVGSQMPSSTCFLIDIFNLEKIPAIVQV